MNSAAKRWLIPWLVVGAVISLPVVDACTWSHGIWAIRTKPADPLFRFVRNGKSGYIDASGKIVIPPTLPKDAGEFHEGLTAASDGRHYRYVDRSGTTAFRIETLVPDDFSEGLAAASRSWRGKWGFIDRSGRFVIEPAYDHAYAFSEGLARVSVSGEVGSTGYIDTHGNFAIPPRLSYGSSFHQGLAAVIIGGPCRITNGGSCARAEFAPTKLIAMYDCRYAFVDKSGMPVSDLRFDDARDFSENLAPVRIGRKWGYVDRSGHLSIEPIFELAEPFSEGLAAVLQNGKMGFIHHSGEFVIPPQFWSAESFSDGRALVTERNHEAAIYRFIDTAGKPAFPGTFPAASSFAYGLANVALGDTSKASYARINTSGKPVFAYNGQ